MGTITLSSIVVAGYCRVYSCFLNIQIFRLLKLEIAFPASNDDKNENKQFIRIRVNKVM